MTDAIHIFVHNITSRDDTQSLNLAVPGARRYDQRALLIARAEDIVCLHGEVDDEYLNYLHTLGIGPQHDRVVVTADNGTTLPEALVKDRASLDYIRALVPLHSAVVLNPYIASPREFALATALERLLCRKIPVLGGNPDIVTRANRKDVVLKEACTRGVPVAPGEIVEFAEVPPDVERLREAVLRQIGATGKVIVRCVKDSPITSPLIINNNTTDVIGKLRWLVERQTLHTYLVQVMFNITVSPNVQFNIPPDGGFLSYVSVSDQILDVELSHQGNVSPSLANTLPEMIASARKISDWLQGEDYTGIFGIDFVEHICPQTAKPAHFLAELNARVNAATYPHILMNRLGLKGAFLSLSVTSSARSFSEFRSRCGRFLFDPATGSGVIPYNTGCLSYGKCWLAIYGETRHVVQELYRSIVAIC
jgi:pre ATP-grasp domain-containing protein